MKHVTLTINGQDALLGHVEMSQTLALRANGRVANDGQIHPSFSNINDLPEAPVNTGMMADTRVATPSGPRRIDELSAGDLVLDTQGREAKINHVLTTDAPRNSFLMRAPYFGLDQDLVVAPEQKIVVTSDIAEYLFGEETVIMPVWALNDGRKVGHFETRSSDLMYQLQLDTPEPLAIGRCAVSALYKDGATEGRVLSDEEARCFATEHRVGFQN
ncbi:Hint domain-containing protein [Litoreibacter meonggei]|uniref:Hint domain-containing protein n=1 Tax=Litoreibacter meonggei TaxID=1049199 RepID=A0A497VTI3_9RHOB|nr:Hint domain-containing protein [Litoreibacter meonggei]RLJ41349.1 Hint domain-containing protein [Litoreibacter meonggei]